MLQFRRRSTGDLWRTDCPVVYSFGRRASLLLQAPITARQDSQPANRHRHRAESARKCNCRAPPTEAKTWEKVRGHGHLWRTDCGGGRRYRAVMRCARASTCKSLRVWEAILRSGGRYSGIVDNVDRCIFVHVGSPRTPKINPIYTADTFVYAMQAAEAAHMY